MKTRFSLARCCCGPSVPTSTCLDCPNSGNLAPITWHVRLAGWSYTYWPNTTYSLTRVGGGGFCQWQVFNPTYPTHPAFMDMAVDGSGMSLRVYHQTGGGPQYSDFGPVDIGGDCLFAGEIELPWTSTTNWDFSSIPKPTEVGQVFVSV